MPKLTLLLLLLLLLIAQSITVQQGNQIVIDYSKGLVTMHLFNVSKVVLLGNGIMNLSVVGANYTIQGNVIYIKGENVSITYYTNFSKGVISVNETFTAYITILLPNNYKIVYLSSPPLSYISDNVQNITFYTNSVYLVFSENVVSENSSQLLLVLTITGIALSVITLSFIAYQLLASRARTKVEEPNVKLGDEIDERDIQIMKILKNGSFNITKLSEESNIPRTTVYRRLRRLIKLGYVIEIREKNKVTYKLTEKGKEFIEKLRGE